MAAQTGDGKYKLRRSSSADLLEVVRREKE